MTQRLSVRVVAVLLAAAVCVAVITAPTFAAAAGQPAASNKGAAAASAKYAPLPIPAFEKFFAQQFRVSVMTQSYGVFNATLRMRGSMNFPERVQGELIPLGEPRLNHRTQRRLPHFTRVRGVEDEKLSDLPFIATSNKQQTTSKGAGGEFAVTPGEEERPSLLVVDLQLLHTDSTQGKAQVFYLPAELMALRSQREALGEGTVAPAALVDFTFRLEAPHMSNNPLSDTAALARVSAAAVNTGSQTSTEAAGEGEEEEVAGAAAALSKGEVIFRWITEHEFSAVLWIPMKSDADNDGATSSATRMERVWIYGYAAPSPSMFDRKQRQVPWYNKYLMLTVALLGFVVQIISGWTEGKTRAVKAAEDEQKHKSKEQATLEAALKEQERLNKKKK